MSGRACRFRLPEIVSEVLSEEERNRKRLEKKHSMPARVMRCATTRVNLLLTTRVQAPRISRFPVPEHFPAVPLPEELAPSLREVRPPRVRGIV
jgi:hypothetical protein